MGKFEELLQRRKLYNMERNLQYTNANIQKIFNIIKQLVKDNPNIGQKEVYNYFSNLFTKTNKRVAELPLIQTDTLAYNIFRDFSSDPDKLQKVVSTLNGQENGEIEEYIEEKDVTTFDKSYWERYFIAQKILEYRSIKNSEFAQLFQTISPKQLKQFENKISPWDKSKFQSVKRCFIGDDENTQLMNYIKYAIQNEIKSLERKIKEGYIYSIIEIGESLIEFDLLEDFYKKQNNVYQRLSCQYKTSETGLNPIKSGLSYPISGKEKDTLTLKELFSRKTLQGLNIEQLSALNAYWINRFTKELYDMNQSFFVINSLGLTEDMIKAAKSGNEYFNINNTDVQLRMLYEKIGFLEVAIEMVTEEFAEIETENSLEKRKTYKVINSEPFIKKADEDMGEQYQEYFNKLEDGMEHNLYQDLMEYMVLENAKSNSYGVKDRNIIAILSNLYQESFSNNWGIILEDEKQIRRARTILIGVDIEGLNMPLRLHMPKNTIKDFLSLNQENMLIPIYLGERDFKIGDYTDVTTQVLMPLCKKQIQTIKAINADTENPDFTFFAEHLAFLVDKNNYPEHLKVGHVEGSLTKKVIPNTRYIDLDTGDEVYPQNVKIEL